MDGAGQRLVNVLGGLGLVFLVAPMAIVALASLDPGNYFQFPPQSLSLHWYDELLSDESWTSAIRFTLVVASLSAVFATLVGALAGVAIARLPPAARRVAYVVVAAPLAIPPIVIAISLYGVALRLRLVGNTMSFVVANALLTAPLVALLVATATLGVNRQLEYASLACGAGPLRTLRAITLPMIAPVALAGGTLSFLLTLDEAVISSFLVGPGHTPVAVKLLLHIETGASPIATAASTLLIVGSMTVVAIVVLLRSARVLLGASAPAAAVAAPPSVTVSEGAR